MKQAIEEGFILDVLANYTTYKAFFELIKSTEDDPKVPKIKASKSSTRFMNLHPHNLRQKVESSLNISENTLKNKSEDELKLWL